MKPTELNIVARAQHEGLSAIAAVRGQDGINVVAQVIVVPLQC